MSPFFFMRMIYSSSSHHHVSTSRANTCTLTDYEMSRFLAHSRLHVNSGKSAILLKGEWPPHLQALLSPFGIPIQSSYKYLGIVLGHVTSEQSFSLALTKALAKAYPMRSWGCLCR